MLKQKTFKMAILSGMFLLPGLISAQQAIADYNLLDNGGTLSYSVGSNETLKFINDKNEFTTFVESNFKNTYFLYESSTPFVITGYSIVTADDRTCDPGSFTIEASNDKETWERLASVLGFADPGRFQNNTVYISKPTSFKYIRLTIRDNSKGESLKISELQFFGYPSPLADDLTKTGGTLTGQYQGNSSESIDNLIGTDLSKKFKQNGAKNFWVQYELAEPKTLKAYSLTSTGQAEYANNIRSWQLLASNDEENWDVLDVRSNKNVFAISNNMQVFKIAEESKNYNWTEYADKMQDATTDLFWAPYGSGMYLREAYHVNPDSIHRGFNYWWMAHALDVMVDSYARTDNAAYREKMNQIYSGMLSFGNNSLRNNFYDDMEWMALACLRAYEVNNVPRWKDTAIQLWNWIEGGWTDVKNGGIMWEVNSPSSKNACSNAPAIIIAGRLYQLTGEAKYKEWAIKIFDWMNNYMLFDNGIVKDGYGNENFEGWTLTYNQGTWIGGCLELYKITGEQKYYDIAMKNADYVVNDGTKFSPYGILYNNEGGGDGGLFKGIFMRNLANWILSGKLDEERQNRFVTYFIENGKSVWESAMLKPNAMINNTWTSRYQIMTADASKKSGYYSSVHLSGMMLFELLAEMERKGVLPENNVNPAALANKDKAYKYFRLIATANNGGSNIELSKWQLFDVAPSNIEDNQQNAELSRVISVKGTTVFLDASTETELNYLIYDVQGRLIDGGELSTSKEIDLSSGIYIVKISKDKESYSQKVIL